MVGKVNSVIVPGPAAELRSVNTQKRMFGKTRFFRPPATPSSASEKVVDELETVKPLNNSHLPFLASMTDETSRKSNGEQTKMISGDGIPRWSVYDSVKIIPSKPDALMAEINSAISSLEYAKAMKLLNSPALVSKDKKNVDDDDGNPNSSYNARKADEAYKAGLASLAAGNLDEAFRSLNVALSKCPPNKTSAVAKLRSLISLTAQRLRKSPG